MNPTEAHIVLTGTGTVEQAMVRVRPGGRLEITVETVPNTGRLSEG